MVAKLKGEAFFDLIPDSKRDLIVDVGHFRIKDVGTKFNIRTYDDEKIISSSLIEGSIELLNASGNPFLVVKPGESVNYDKTSRSANIKNIDSSVVTAWKDGKFVFIDEPLSEICKELENWYNVEIRIEDRKLAETRYTSVVRRSTTVEMVLKILALTDKIKYEIMDKTEGKDVVTIKK
jgi:ferric-dicitrate binding protein FerR (iron transport regulator)